MKPYVTLLWLILELAARCLSSKDFQEFQSSCFNDVKEEFENEER